MQRLNISVIHQHRRVLRQQRDRREAISMLGQLLQREQRVAMLLFQRLERIGAVRQMHRRGRNIESLQRLQVLAQIVPKTVLAVGLPRAVAGDVAVLALVLAARVHVDAIAMPRRELPLIGERTVPLDDSRPSDLQHILLRPMRQEIKRHGRPVGLAQLIENRPVLRMNPLGEREALAPSHLGKHLLGEHGAACVHGMRTRYGLP